MAIPFVNDNRTLKARGMSTR